MDDDLDQLKKNFIVIKNIRTKVTTIFEILEGYLTKLKKIYADFIKNNSQKLFIFTLDSFQFQSKLIDIEFDDLMRLFLVINNRMYGEYYKLYKIVSEYVQKTIPDNAQIEVIIKGCNFPIYNDIEPFKEYNFDKTQEIHDVIVNLLYKIHDFILTKENDLQSYQKKQDIGLNINNFIITFNHNILMIKEKCSLFISYTHFFHSLHTKYLQRFATKINLLYSQVTTDINFDVSPNVMSPTSFKDINYNDLLLNDEKSIDAIECSNYDANVNIEKTMSMEILFDDLTKQCNNLVNPMIQTNKKE